MPDSFPCGKCGKEFPSQKALSGHMGGTTTVLGAARIANAHSTRKGYQRHIRNGEEACILCKRANNAYARTARAKSRLAARRGKK